MQAARLTKNLRAGTQVQMIRISQDYLRMDVVIQIALMHTLNRSYRSDRHEYRRKNIAMVRMQHTRTGTNC
jgi:hypothetical protein